MRKIAPVVVILLISGLGFLGYIHATENLKLFISGLLEENFDAGVSIGYIGLGFPICLELKDVKINDSVDISRMRIYPNPASFLLKNSFDFYCTKILIHGDKGEGSRLEFAKVKGSLRGPGVYFSKDDIFQFAARGFIKNRGTDFLSPLKIKGHLDPRDIIKARLYASDIKLDTLGSIYDKYLRRGMQGCRVDLESDLEVSRNSLAARCSLKGKDIVLKKDSGQDIDMPVAASFILLINFKNNLVKIKDLQSNFLELVINQS